MLYFSGCHIFFETNEAQVPLSNAESPQCRPIDGVTIETFQISVESKIDISGTMAAEMQ